MTNLDLLSTNCVTHSDYENFSNKGEVIEGFVDTLTKDSSTGEILKMSDGIPVKHIYQVGLIKGDLHMKH